MDDSNERKFQKELNGGLVGLVLLAVLAESDEDLYGYEIAKRLASANDGTSIFKEGTIYPVLRALSAGSLLTSRIVPSYSGPPRRYYRITEQGRSVLAEWKLIWQGTRRLRRSIYRNEIEHRTFVMNRSAPRSIDQYLRQLREELAGADSALIQDALYDAEEYLRAEVAAHPDKSESDVLELIASTYGAPDEVASAYRDTEVKVKAAMATPRKEADNGGGQVLRRVSGSARLYLLILHAAVAGHRHHLFRVRGNRACPCRRAWRCSSSACRSFSCSWR